MCLSDAGVEGRNGEYWKCEKSISITKQIKR